MSPSLFKKDINDSLVQSMGRSRKYSRKGEFSISHKKFTKRRADCAKNFLPNPSKLDFLLPPGVMRGTRGGGGRKFHNIMDKISFYTVKKANTQNGLVVRFYISQNLSLVNWSDLQL